MNTMMLAEIETLAQEIRNDLASFCDQFAKEVAEINLRLERLAHTLAESNRRIVEQHRSLVAQNAQLESIDARLERVERTLDRRGP